ncbi:MAG: hypothetical protein INQ03_19810 [Candidatus Heimdallarchaeota archaeon]|nr:hypothetical protein [Candidatus Heimdallarchaeota archaeon]
MSSQELKQYHGITLQKQDCTAMLMLENHLGPIPERSKITYNDFGYTHKNSRVTGLCLYNKGIRVFPRSILKLTALNELVLYKNQIDTILMRLINFKSSKFWILRRIVFRLYQQASQTSYHSQ